MQDPSKVKEITQIASDIISEFEGNHKLINNGTSVESYWDPRGRVWTIGKGLTGPDIQKGTVWPIAYAETRFRQKLGYFVEGVLRLVKVGLTPMQYAALVSFAYNMGLDEDDDEIPEGLGDSTLLKKINAGDWAGAYVEWPKWNKAWDEVAKKRIPVNGLTRRRARELSMFREG